MKLNRGVSLIEVMIAVSLTAALIAVATWFWHDIRQSFEFGINQYSLTDKVTQTGRKIVNELRRAQEAMNGAYPLAILDDNQLAFYADIDNDGLIEYVRYFVDDDKLMRGSIRPSGNPPNYQAADEHLTIVVDQIDIDQLPLFTYYNENWPGDTENNPLGYWERPLETRIVGIKIPIKIEQRVGVKEYSADFMVQIRNLKNNL